MKKTMGIVLSSLAFLMAGSAAISSANNAKASDISNASLTDQYNFVLMSQEPSKLTLVSPRDTVDVINKKPFTGFWQDHNSASDTARMNAYNYISDKNGGYDYEAGSQFVAAKYKAIDGTNIGKTFYLVNRPELPNTKVWIMDNNDGNLLDETTISDGFTKLGNDLSNKLDKINQSLQN